MGRVWPIRLLAAGLIGGAALLRLVYLAWYCPLDLAPDEAHYWDWSRHLDWSYYSKGPLVALLIRLGCAIAGPWSRGLTGTEMLAVRLPAVLCGSLLLVGLYVLTRQVYRREGLALGVVALALTLPLVAAGSTLMTIDAPFTCLWVWALVFGFHAIFRQATWAWYATGVAVGLGLLAKYTMVLWLLSLGLFCLATPTYRPLLRRRGFWIMTGLALTACLPILLWNMQHDWVTLRHTSRHAGFQAEARPIYWLGPLNYLAMQFAVLLGFWFIVWLRAMWRHQPAKEMRPELTFLWWMSIPTFVFFLLFSWKNGGGEPNWPVAAYLAGLVLALGWLAQEWTTAGPVYKKFLTISIISFSMIGLTVTCFVHVSQVLYPWLERLSGPVTTARPLPLRRVDPTCRLRGWRTLATAVDQWRHRLAAEGIEPFLAAGNWTLPGELGFYCQGQPTVYSLGAALGDRHSQYDLWRPNPVADPQVFTGRSCLFIGDVPPTLRAAFDQVEQVQIVTHHEQGHPIARWTLSIGHGYRGCPDIKSGQQSY